VLRVLEELEHSGFGWGYNGGGTGAAAAAILADALDVDDERLWEDFCIDVLAVCVTDLPEAVTALPAVDPPD
jgi:hypothetical protein